MASERDEMYSRVGMSQHGLRETWLKSVFLAGLISAFPTIPVEDDTGQTILSDIVASFRHGSSGHVKE